MKTSETVGKLMAALAKAQAEYKPAPKDSKNPHFNSKYADLESVVMATGPVLAKHGIAWAQGARHTDYGWVMVTRISLGDEWIETEWPILQDKSAQTFKSGATYSRRGGFEATTGTVSTDDNDGQDLPDPIKPTQNKPAATSAALRGSAVGQGVPAPKSNIAPPRKSDGLNQSSQPTLTPGEIARRAQAAQVPTKKTPITIGPPPGTHASHSEPQETEFFGDMTETRIYS